MLVNAGYLLRRVFGVVVLVLGVLVLVFGVGSKDAARAQTATVVEVPADWALVPSGVGPGGAFRLLFRTRLATTAESSDIGVYDSFVQGEAATGHAAVREHASRFKAVGSTASVDARDHVGMNPTDGDHLDVPVYWLNGALVASGSAGFWSDSWAAAARTACRDEFGEYLASCNKVSGLVWTGSNTDGTKHANPLGGGVQARVGRFFSSQSFSAATVHVDSNYNMLAVSQVFRVEPPPPAMTANYTQVYEGERKVIVFETQALSVDFTVSAVGGLTANDYRIFSPHGSATPVSGTSWRATASNGLVKFGLEGVDDGEADPGEVLRVTLRTNEGARGQADIRVRDGERPLSLLFRVKRGSPTEEWVETDRPAVVLREGGADVSYQLMVSKPARGYETARVHISPNAAEVYRIDNIRPGPWDDDRFIYRDPGPHMHGDSTSLIIGVDGWSTVTFGAGQDEDAHNHGLTLYHRVSPRALAYSSKGGGEVAGLPGYREPEFQIWPRLDGPDSRWFANGLPGTPYAAPLASGCYLPSQQVACWTWPLSVQIVDDDKWEQEVVYARHDPGANDGNGGPDGNWVLASDGGLRAALPAVLAPGSEYTFYVRLAVDPATLPKDGTVSRNQTENYFVGGQLRSRQVDVYPPTFLPKRIPVWVRVKGALNDGHGVPDMRLLITPHSRAGVRPNTGTYFITDTSGTRNHPSVEADYNYRDNTLPGEKGDLLFWDEPMAVTIKVREDAPLGVVRGISVNSDSGMLTRPGCGRGWSKYNCSGDYFGYYFWDGADIGIGLVEDLQTRGQFSAQNFAPRSPEEILEFVKQSNFGNEGELFVPFADVTENRAGVTDGGRVSVIEGESARFIVTLTPAPSEPRAVQVNVVRREGSTALGLDGQLGVRTVMVGPSGSTDLVIPTSDNDAHGDNGYLYVTVVSNPTYRVSSFGGVGEIDVLNDDVEMVYDRVRISRVTDSSATVVWDAQPGVGSYEVIWLEGTTTSPQTMFTADTSVVLTGLEAGVSYDVAVLDDWWNRVGNVEFLTLQPGGGEKVYPVVSVTAGGDITEGGTASFTVTAVPAPTAPLTVPVWVSQQGAYAADGVRGVRNVTIPTSGSVTFTVATVDDMSDEPDGAVVATLERARLGYMLGVVSRASVAVADNDDPSTSPEITVTAGGQVEEGANAVFTVTADPAPAAPVTVSVSVSQVGDYTSAVGSQTVTVPTSGSATLTVATTNDDTDEPHGSVSVTLNTGDGYTVSATQSRATVQVADNDLPKPQISITTVGSGVTEGSDARFFVVAVPKPSAPLTVNVTVGQDGDYGATTGSRTVTVGTGGFATLNIATKDDSTDETDGSVSVTVNAGSGYTISSSQSSASVSVADNDDPPPATPEVSVTAGGGITEGANASFTVSASPAPTTPLLVKVTVSQSGNYATSTGSRTVTVPTSGSATVTVSTSDDSTDETDGSVTVTVNANTGYTISTTQSSASVSVADNDDPPPVTPEISVTAGSGITEGTNASFTVTADPAPASPLSVRVTVSQNGNYATSTGSRTVTVPTSGTATVTVSTTDDSTDETNGSVTVTVNAQTGYTISGSQSSATVNVADNDDPPPVTPEVSVTAGSGITEGGNASFTVTASPAPSAPLQVSVTVSQNGNYGAPTGSRTVTVGTGGTATVTVSTSDDNVDETDGSVTVTVNARTGYTVSSSLGSATVAVADNDDSPPTDLPVVSIADASSVEGPLGGYYLRFVVTLSERADRNVIVHYEVRQGTARLLRDYIARSWRIVLRPGQTSGTIWVQVRDDRIPEDDETLQVVLTRANGATITDGTATGTIIDND
ncbi:MAG: hypothetical protein OXH10_08405 [bacterium]|nr:hypothetical protein [bacterium]